MAVIRSHFSKDLPSLCGEDRRSAPSMNPSELAKLKEAEFNLRSKFHALCRDKFY